MNKNKYIFGLIGLALGFIVSFFWTQSINNSEVSTSAAARPAGTAAGGGGPQSQQAMMGDVRETLEKAKNNPKDFEAQVEAARSYDQIGRNNEAVEFLKKAYEINPTKTGKIGAFPYIGQWYFEQKRYDEAEAWFRRGAEVDPNEADLYVMIAETLTLREPPIPDKAIQEIQRALKISPRNGHAMIHLIDAYLLKRDARGAEQALAQLKQADSGNQKIAVYENLIADLKAGKAVAIPKE